MSNFDGALKKAQVQQRLVFALGGLGLFIAVLVVLGMIVFTNGTTVNVLPDEAAQDATLNVVEGFGLSVGEAVYAIASEPVVRVSAPGFKPEQRKILFSEKGTAVTVTLRELPGQITATTQPENPDTQWSIDGDRVDIAPSLSRAVEAGEHVIGVGHPYFEDISQTIVARRGSTHILVFDLTPVKGQLSVQMVPTDAELRIDGKPAPLTQAKPGGAYQIEVSHPDYVTLIDTVEITQAQPNVDRTYRLNRKSATLTFELSPKGGELLVGGSKVLGDGPVSVSSKVETSIAYFKPGYFSQSQTVTLQPDENKTVSIALQREVGSVEVTAQPTAEVKVNGQVVGKTPLTLKLPAVAQSIELSKPGYRSVSKTVTPSAQKTVSVKVQLQTELAARLAAAPPHYTNGAGISLKLFHPSEFNMGAPRSELGQRANEFQRTIKLTKPFYASLHEITNGEYAKFKASGSSSGADNFPVTSVSWSDAAAYCNWLSAKEHLQPVYVLHGDALAGVNKSADGYRLLTEAEWEWLARRAGRKTQTIFPWGDKSVVPPLSGNISDESARGHADFYVPKYNDGHAEMAAVGSFPAEPSGLFDVAGNASEWVHDYYSLVPPDAGDVDVDPMGPDYGDAHVVKGSSWRSGTRTELRGAYRDGLNGTRDDIGFRIGRYVYGGSK